MADVQEVPATPDPQHAGSSTDRWWRRGVFLGLALVGMTLVAYLPAIRDGGFIWDDDDYVYENKTLLDARGLKDIWTDPQATPQYYPLVHTGYWIEYRLWGLNPTGYHVTNILLHALGSVLLWRLLRWLAVPGAWLAAALFALHPIHVESVAWITERKNVLSGVFYLAAALTYFKWADAKSAGQRRPRTYLGALLLFVCAMLSKTTAATLPAALLLVAWWRDGKRPHAGEAVDPTLGQWLRQRVLPLIPFFVIGISLSLITIWLEKHHVGAKGAEWEFSLIERGLIAGRVLWFYIAKLLWPVEFCFNYPRWNIDAASWWQYFYPAAFAAVIAVCWFQRKRLSRGPLVALLFYAGTTFPALGFFAVYPMRYSFVADHFAYLANIGVLVLVAAAITLAGRKCLSGAGIAIAAALALVPLALLSGRECAKYRGHEELWHDTIAKNPGSWMAYNNLGQIRLHQQNPQDALVLLEKAVALNPAEVSAINNLGVALTGLGRIDEGITRYRQAINVDPDDIQAYNNLGTALANQGKRKQATEHFQKAVDLQPELAASRINLAMSLGAAGKTGEAMFQFRQALELDPDFAMGHLKFGEFLHGLGRVREAADHYRTALAADPSLATAHHNLGIIAVNDQLIPAAVDHFQKALELDPRYADAQRNLAKVFMAQGRIAEAGERFRRAAMLAPNSGPIRLEHADFLAANGDKVGALQEYLSAARLMPDNPHPLFQAAVLEQKGGNPASVAHKLREVIRLAPNHAPAHNHLAVWMAGAGHNQEAIGLMQKAASLEPSNAEYQNNLGVLLVRAGQYPLARVALEQAVRLKPDYAEARKNLDDLRRLMNSGGQP